MIKEALKFLIEMGGIHNKILIDGSEYVTSGEDSKIVRRPVLEPLCCNTLTGIVDFINMDEKLLESKKVLIYPVCIHIKNHNHVSLIGNLDENWEGKRIWVKAACEEYDTKHFSKPLEDFLVWIQTFFVQDTATISLLSVLSKITASYGIEITNKGISLAIERKKDIHFKEKDDMRSQFILRPHRTFTEIDQPASVFVLRVHGNLESGINITMDRTTDPTWEIRAIESIKKFFQKRITDSSITIIA